MIAGGYPSVLCSARCSALDSNPESNHDEKSFTRRTLSLAYPVTGHRYLRTAELI